MAENCDPHSEMCGKSQRAPERKLFPFRCSACLWDLSNPRYEVAHFLRGLLLHLPCGVGAAGDPASQENFNCISGESSHANSTNFDCFRYYIRSCKQKVGGRGKRKSPLLKSGDFLHYALWCGRGHISRRGVCPFGLGLFDHPIDFGRWHIPQQPDIFLQRTAELLCICPNSLQPFGWKLVS